MNNQGTTLKFPHTYGTMILEKYLCKQFDILEFIEQIHIYAEEKNEKYPFRANTGIERWVQFLCVCVGPNSAL